MPAAVAGAFWIPVMVAMPVAPGKPGMGGGTVAGKVCWPVQNRPQSEVMVMGGKTALELVPCIRSVMRPPQPLEAIPLGIALCHWLLWSECEKSALGTMARLLVR
jgi:hypothetical protein